jgi:hypothetical protein
MIFARRLTLLALTLAGAVCLAAPGVSLAATAAVDKEQDRLVLTAAPGEANRVTVTGAAGLFTLEDVGAPISGGLGCVQLLPNRVRCSSVPGGPITSVVALLGDMGDTLTASAAIPTGVDGGPGDDVLRGSATTDYFFGGAGDDLLDGGLGADFLSGGDGRDRADYSARTAPVTISADGLWNDGQAGEADNVATTIEDLAGGSGDDTLAGGAAANQLLGGDGADALTGGDGGDAIDGGAGTDKIDAGGGDDAVHTRDGEFDAVACGAGTDAVESDAEDGLAGDCERAGEDPIPALQPKLDRVPRTVRLSRKGYVRIKIVCPVTAIGGCAGRVTVDLVRRARSSVAAVTASGARGKSFDLKAGESKVTKVKISRNGRRRILRKKRAKCRVSVRARSAGGQQVTVRKKIIVKAPKRGRAT